MSVIEIFATGMTAEFGGGDSEPARFQEGGDNALVARLGEGAPNPV